jgi:hypothetical protein
MKPSGLYYGNIFQTASNGRGLGRVVRPPGQEQAAFDIFAGRLPAGYRKKIYRLEQYPRERTYQVSISVENNEIEVIVNGKRVLRDIDKNIRYRVTDIAVGTGYNKERGIKGRYQISVLNILFSH